MNIIHKIFNPHNSLVSWLLSIGMVLLAALLVVGQDMDVYAARSSKKSKASDRRLERVVTGNERRIALVIGNDNYQHATTLKNAVADAAAFRRELEQRGFTVVYQTNATRRQMNNAIEDFLGKLSTDAVGLVYYAGHGVQINSANYLLPTDIEAAQESDVANDGIDLGRLLDRTSQLKTKFTLAVIDACRNNPFSPTGRTIGGSRGLAPSLGNATGIMVVYSAGANQTALDKVGDDDPNPNGLFTREFIKVMRKPGLTVQSVVNEVKEAVIEQADSIGHEQTPAIYDQSRGKFYFSAPTNEPRERVADRLVVKSEEPVQPVETVVEPVVVVRPQRKSFEPETVAIPAGSFEMGSPDSEAGRYSNEGPVHTVNVKAFRMGKYEVTRGQFRAFVDATSYKTDAENGDGCYGWNGSSWEKKPEYNWLNLGFAQEDNHPVACVSWNDVVAYTEWLSEQTGKSYRLPSEAEWEYAARAGTTTARYWGNNPSQACKYANVADQTAKRRWSNWTVHECDDGYEVTSPVGQFKANAFKLYDMLGNVWEWTCSQYDSNGYSGKETTCANKGNSDARAVRGGAWDGGPTWVRAAFRISVAPAVRNYGLLGIRLVQD